MKNKRIVNKVLAKTNINIQEKTNKNEDLRLI